MIATTLGPYRIEAELGSGGMGTVYLASVAPRGAEGDQGGSLVALKLIHAHLLATPGFFKRFLREAEIGKRVRHENVVATLDVDAVEVEGKVHHFLVMEYVEGRTLRDLARELERVPEELCRHIGREVAKGLAAIHAAGVVHRDVKPENVLITKDHVVKVMDLGVARLIDEALRLSQTGAFVGSIHYAAPEQFHAPFRRDDASGARSAKGAVEIDGRADLHALGLVLYELSGGVNPYLADDVPQILERILHEEPRRLGDVNPQLSPFFEEVVHCLLAKRPSDRFADANALVAVLEEGERSAWWKARADAIRAETRRPLRRIRIERETAVYGRDAELARLRALFDRAAAGDGQVAVVEGEAGIGKSRLVDEFVGQLQRDGADVNFLFGTCPPGGAATAAGAFSTAYREQFGEAGAAGWLPQTPVLAPAFDALLRGETTPAACEPLTKDSIHTCFVHATRNLAAERTTIVLIDDLHFAPDEGRALFAALAMAVPGHRILLVGTTRPGVDEEWLAQMSRIRQTTRLPLARIGPKDLVRLLADTLRSDHVAAELSAQIALKSDGNPFFVFEILRGLREGQFIAQSEDGTWVTTRRIDEIRIPSSVLDLVSARVADLSDAERNLLDVAACWGFEFDPSLVGTVLSMPRIPVLQAFGNIEKRHRLVRSAGRNCLFDHHQVQEALYGALNEQLREEYHAALAAALETRTHAAEKDPEALDGALCVELCEHFLGGAKAERALRYLSPALTHLERGYLNARTVSLAERALAVAGMLTGIERAKTLLRLAATNGPLDRLGRRARQEEAARESERLAADAADDFVRGRAAQSLGSVLWRTSRHAEAEAAVDRALGAARTRGDRAAEAAALSILGCSLYSQSRLAEAREQHERSLALSREIGDRRGEAIFTGNLGNVLRSEGRLDEARVHYERHLALSREVLDRQSEATATLNLGTVLRAQGRLAEARERYERALVLCREIGHRGGEMIVTGNLGNALRSEGRLAEAREHMERGRALSREIGDRFGEAIALVNLGPTWLALGDRGRAQQALEESLELCRAIGARFPEGYALMELGRLAEEGGDVRSAAGLLEDSLAARRRIGHGDGVAESLIEIGDLRRCSGDADGARTALDEAFSLSRAQGRAAETALAHAMLACLPGGDSVAAMASLAQAVENEHSQRTRWLLWIATGDRAHLTEAKRLLDESLAKVPPLHHAAMLGNVRLNREIAAAAREAGV